MMLDYLLRASAKESRKSYADWKKEGRDKKVLELSHKFSSMVLSDGISQHFVVVEPQVFQRQEIAENLTQVYSSHRELADFSSTNNIIESKPIVLNCLYLSQFFLLPSHHMDLWSPDFRSPRIAQLCVRII